MSARRMTLRARETRKTPPARALPPAAAAAIVVLAALSLTGCGEMDLLGLVRLRVTGSSVLAIYVSPDGSDSNSGFSPDEPLNDIEEAMNRAERSGATEVRVAEGTYVIDTASENRIGMRPGVALKGGYSSDFATWDPESHESIIRTEDIIHEFINASGPEVQDASIEDFTIDVAISEPEGEEYLELGVITIHNGASVSVLNNRFLVHLSGNFDKDGKVIGQWTNEEDQPAQYNMVIHGNDILITSDTPGDRQVTAIQLGQQASGSDVVVSANRIVVFGDGPASGIRIADCENLKIWNNVISVIGGGDADGICVGGGGMTREIVNNTIIVTDGGAGNAEGIVFSGGGGTSEVEVWNNILGTPDGTGTGLINDHSGTLSFNHNLTFNFGTEVEGNVSRFGTCQFESTDIFAEVFSSAYDPDLSDGDDADYHLGDISGGGPYAVDLGTTFGADVDFEGDLRPQGAAYDRGADEANIGWDISTVDATGDVGRYSSIALDGSGHPSISYFDNTNGDLKYACWNGSAWVGLVSPAAPDTVDSGGEVGMSSSIALEANGYPHISYHDNTNQDLKHAWWDGSVWQTEAVDSTASNVGDYSSIALDSNGCPHISYFDSTNMHLRYARWDGANWQIENADLSDVGLGTSLAVDGDDYPHIAYRDYGSEDLKYTRWNGSAWVGLVSLTEPDTVDEPGNVGQWPSLALDSDGYAHISYLDETNGDLKYARWDGSAWQIETVDGAVYVGRYTSIAVNSGGYPHISYYDGTNDDLKYARWDGSAWQIETVDNTASSDVGWYTSIVLDSGGNPHISYLDHTGLDLKYARWGVIQP